MDIGICRGGRLKRAMGVGLVCSLMVGERVWGFEDFRDVPYVWGQDLGRFGGLFEAAKTQTVRIAILGDSQETTPFGRGSIYVPQLNYQAYKTYGNVPETMVVGCDYYGAGGALGEWLLAGLDYVPKPTETRLASNQMLPGMTAAAHSTLNGGVNINGQTRGQLTMLVPNGAGLHADVGIPTDVSYFKTDGVVKAQVFAATNASSGEVYYRARPTDLTSPQYASAVTTQGVLPLGLESSGPLAVKSGLTGALDFAGKRSMQVELSGDNDAKRTDIMGMRYVNETHPEGMVFQRLAAGGYTIPRFMSSHGDAGEFFAAIDFDAAILHFGANDISNGGTAAAFKENVLKLMGMVRSWTGNDQFKFILAAETDEILTGPGLRQEFDQYAGVMYSIAKQDNNVMVLNTRRLMHAQGWVAGGADFGKYVMDTVHYTPEGSIRLAEAEFGAMSSVVGPGGWRVVDGDVKLAAGSGTMYVRGLSILGQGRLDVANNDLVVAALAGTQEDVYGQVSGWVGQGRIGSSALDAHTGLGVILNHSGAGGVLVSQFGGYDVDANSVLLKYTWNGDANLDGVVNADDYFLADSGYITQKGGWYNGDFNHDGVMNADDYFLIDSAYIAQDRVMSGSGAKAMGVVPEPGMMGVIVLGVVAMMGRRRSRSAMNN